VAIVTNEGRPAMHIGAVMQVQVVSARPDETAADAIRRMLDAGIGSVVVVEDTTLVGIFTERDVLRLAGSAADFERVPLRTAMTRDPLTISADDGILEAAQLMGERRLRHLPVVQDGNLVGMVSIRDVLGFLAERLYVSHDETAAETARSLLGR
jgi:CBS domain-containing protein